ncbi:MAG: endopeptidase La [Fimbriimonadales bacterium]|nr:endopeptidase La [Fimbriimonadales bacterium]
MATERRRYPVVPVRDAVYFPGLIHALHVARSASRQSLERALEAGRRIVCVLQRNPSVEDPEPEDLSPIGTLCELLSATRLPDGTYRVALRGLARGRIGRPARRHAGWTAEFVALPDPIAATEREEALAREVLEGFSRLVEEGGRIPPESLAAASVQECPSRLGWVVAHHLPLKAIEKQAVLESESLSERLEAVLRLILREQRVLACRSEIWDSIRKEATESQREAMLREQLRAVQEQLRRIDGRLDPLEELRRSFADEAYPEAVRRRAEEELARLERTGAFTPEGSASIGYLEWLRALPWTRKAPAPPSLPQVRATLDARHYGLERPKRRVIEQLAVLRLRPDAQGPVLCFVGPPGVGKTSLARAVAEAMGRPFVSVALGGVRDDAEIRGHRRTYVGAMPGRIVQGLRNAGVRNPVVLLDELDKLGLDGRGDPAGALLEVLDPAQNGAFLDLYVDLPIDLSGAFFIVTANHVENLPRALRDRLEPVEFESYTPEERLAMARSHLVPKALAEAGLSPDAASWSEEAIRCAVEEFEPEPGVRSLYRRIAAVCRWAALQLVETGRTSRIGRREVLQVVGAEEDPLQRSWQGDLVGVANALVVSELGGAVLPIEVALVEASGASPSLSLTGNLGSIMRESAQTAFTYVRSIRGRLGIAHPLQMDVHVHAQEGGVPKDGPSAGLAIAVALASAWTGRQVPADTAWTGELTLRGRVLPVGGLREKLLAVQRAGLRRAVVPEGNRAQVERLPESLLAALEIVCVSDASQAIKLLLEG